MNDFCNVKLAISTLYMHVSINYVHFDVKVLTVFEFARDLSTYLLGYSVDLIIVIAVNSNFSLSVSL